MVLTIIGKSGSGKTQKACKYAMQRGKFLMVDYNRGFVKEFHAPEGIYDTFFGASVENEEKALSNCISSLQYKTIILDGALEVVTNREDHTRVLRDIISLCNECGVDVIFTLTTFSNNMACERLPVSLEISKKYINYDLKYLYPTETLRG